METGMLMVEMLSSGFFVSVFSWSSPRDRPGEIPRKMAERAGPIVEGFRMLEQAHEVACSKLFIVACDQWSFMVVIAVGAASWLFLAVSLLQDGASVLGRHSRACLGVSILYLIPPGFNAFENG